MARMRPCVATTFVIAAFVSALPRPAGARVASADDEQDRFDVEARLMLWADASERQRPSGEEEPVRDFIIRRARVVVQAGVSESIGLYFQFGQDNIGAQLLTEDGSIRIKDAFVNYRGADAFQVAAGQFKVPFLRANLESGFNQILVDRAALAGLRPAREGSRDLGAMAWGNVDGLQYRLAVFDGSDQEARDSGSSFRVSTRLAYNWFTHETGLGYTGSYLGARRVLQLAGQVDVQGARLDPRDETSFQSLLRDYRSYALEAFFEQPFAGTWSLTIDGAWFDRRDDYDALDVPARRLNGYYFQTGLLLPAHTGPGRVQLALRREDWDAERGAAEAGTTRTTGGATYYLKGHDRKVQADYTRRRGSLESDSNEFRLSVVVVF